MNDEELEEAAQDLYEALNTLCTRVIIMQPDWEVKLQPMKPVDEEAHYDK